jgi:hypothetical protein
MRPTPNSSSDTPTGPSIELTTQAVVASYIHAISERHHRTDQPANDQPTQPTAD